MKGSHFLLEGGGGLELQTPPYDSKIMESGRNAQSYGKQEDERTDASVCEGAAMQSDVFFGWVPRIRSIAGTSTPYDLPQKGILAKWPGRSSSSYGSRSIDGSSDASDEHMSYCLNS